MSHCDEVPDGLTGGGIQDAASDDTWISPFAAENSGTASLQDPRRAKPSPHVSFDKRLLSQTFAYDWLGNTSATDDDADGFYDRSLGTITNGAVTGTDPKPYQLLGADNTATGSTRSGALEAAYDPAGNLKRLQVERDGPCLPSAAKCKQVFAYRWDEVGRLADARRWDVAKLKSMSDPLPSGTPNAHLRYAYDAGDQRVLKTAIDGSGNERHRLRLSDVDAERGTLLVREGKGRKDRMLPVGERALTWLARYAREVRPELVVLPDPGWLFLTISGESMVPDYLTQQVRRYVKQAELGKGGSCHTFRHTMATLMLEGGADVRYVQEMLGHAHLDSTQVYTRVSIRKLKAIHSATHPGAKLERASGDDER